MTQSLYKSLTVNDQYLEDYEEDCEKNESYSQTYCATELQMDYTSAITDFDRADESKDTPQMNHVIAALVDRLLKEARTACDVLQQQGQWQQQNITGKIRSEKRNVETQKVSGVLERFEQSSRTSRRIYRKTIKARKEMDITKEISLLISDLTVCC
ncbi:hypothetical protein ACJMK2_012392 [Sinanodonta woodiana]|uniref:Uncharacterized protein n=1 Tax=Sinanodonta woodiana TaxID=1069815 RepID=A0ABD3V836_SINWO